MSLERSKIIVLKNIQHSNSHLIIKGLNKQGEVLSFIARFALKQNRQVSARVLEPGKYIQVEYKPPAKEDGLGTIQKAWIINDFPKMRKDYDRLSTALEILYTVNRLSSSGAHGETELFNLLGNTLKEIETTEYLDRLKLFFEMRFLFLQGVLPEDLQTKGIFFENTVFDHHKIQLDTEELRSLKYSIKLALADYLG